MKQILVAFQIVGWLTLIQYGAFAQFPGGGGLGSSFSGGGGTSGPQKVVLDTSAIYHFYADNPNVIFPYLDSLLVDFQQYDPTRQQPWDWAHLGNLGSAARPLVHQPQFRQGLDVGLHQYDLYQLRTDDIRFYKINQAFTQGYFSQGANQGNAFFKVRFSRTFKKGLNLTIEHRRINDSGYFDHEGVDEKAFALGLWYKTQNNRYEGFLTIATNNVEVEENGGENRPLVLGENNLPTGEIDFEDAFLLDVNTIGGNTRQTNREFAYTQYFYLNSGGKKDKKAIANLPLPDSLLLEQYDSIAALSQDTTLQKNDSLEIIPVDTLLLDVPVLDTIPAEKAPPPRGPLAGKGKKPSGGKPGGRPLNSFPPNPNSPSPPVASTDFTKKRAFTVFHRIKYLTENYKFWDVKDELDTVYYQSLQVDSRGLRYSLKRQMVENTLKLQTFKLRKDERNRRLATQKDLIEVGLKHQIHYLDQDGVDTAAFNNLYLTGSLNFTPSERLKINTYGHFALLDNRGDYRVSGTLFFDLKTIGNLKLEAVNQLYEPTQIQHRFFNTEREIWKNDYDKTLETSLTGTYTIPSIQLSIHGGYHLLTNYIYFDTLSRPQQTNELINIFQIGLEKNFKFGPVHFHNQIIYQKATSDRIRLPELYSKHSLFIEGRVFKKALLGRLGIDARLWTGYRPYTYQPLTGQFHLQETEEVPFTPLLDAFFIAKLTRFRFFFKIENILSSIQQTYYTQTAGYLQPFGFSENGGMRLGVSWRFVD